MCPFSCNFLANDCVFDAIMRGLSLGLNNLRGLK